MKSNKNNSDNYIKINCVGSGIVMITIGAVLIFITLTKFISTDRSSFLSIILISLLSIITGVFQISRPWREEKNKLAEKEYDAEQNKKYLNRKEKAVIKQKNNVKKHKNIFSEIYWIRMSSTGLAAIALGFFAAFLLFVDKKLYGYIFAGACLIVFTYNLAGIPVWKLKKSAVDSGIDYDNLNSDFMFGAMFTSLNSIINIGQKYTVFVGELNSIVIENSKILYVNPTCQETEMYHNGVYTGKTMNHSVVIITRDGNHYKFACAEFQDSMIIDEYIKNNYNILTEYSQMPVLNNFTSKL